MDPVAALTYDLPDGDPRPPERISDRLVMPPPHPGRDMSPVWMALGGIGAVGLLSAAAVGVAAIVRKRGAQ